MHRTVRPMQPLVVQVLRKQMYAQRMIVAQLVATRQASIVIPPFWCLGVLTAGLPAREATPP